MSRGGVNGGPVAGAGGEYRDGLLERKRQTLDKDSRGCEEDWKGRGVALVLMAGVRGRREEEHWEGVSWTSLEGPSKRFVHVRQQALSPLTDYVRRSQSVISRPRDRQLYLWVLVRHPQCPNATLGLPPRRDPKLTGFNGLVYSSAEETRGRMMTISARTATTCLN